MNEEPDKLPKSRNYDLFEHMAREHGLTLLESELIEIIQVVDRMKCESQPSKNPYLGMKNLIHEHPSPEVRAAGIQLLDALCSWERSTGRHNVVIIKDSIGCQYRSLDGSPIPENVKDQAILEAFDNLSIEESAK